jgi:hypothetical protein
MTHYCLTRLLYAADEVCLSLLTALLDHRDLDECYYWTAEMVASGFNLFPFLWAIYFDFYAELNPRLEGYMRTKQSSWDSTRSFRVVCAVVRNMHRAKPTPTVFVLRQAQLAGTLRAGGQGKSPAYAGFPPTHTAWLSALERGDLAAVAHYTYELADSWWPESLFLMMLEFHAQYLGASIGRGMQAYWQQRPGDDDVHHLLAVMVHLRRAPGEVELRRVFVAPTESALLHLAPGESFGRPDRLLAQARKYPVDESIGAFALSRSEVPDPLAALRFSWEYFASRSPVWGQRLLDCGGTAAHATRSVEFRTDEGLEAFYALHGLEPDEQPMGVQILSTAALEAGTAQDWLAQRFGNLAQWPGAGGLDVQLPADWRFRIEIDGCA